MAKPYTPPPRRLQALCNDSPPSLYSQPGGTPDHTPRASRLQDKNLQQLPTGKTSRRPSGDLFVEEPEKHGHAQLHHWRDKSESTKLAVPTPVLSKTTSADSELASPTARAGHNEMRAMHTARRALRYAAQETSFPDWFQPTATSIPPVNHRSKTQPHEWTATLPTGSAEDVSPTFLEAMKRLSVASSASGTDTTTIQRIHKHREHERERLTQETQAQDNNPRLRREYSDRRGVEAHDSSLISDEPASSFSPYLSSERYRFAGEVTPYATKRYGDIDVRPDMRLLDRIGRPPVEEQPRASSQPKVKEEKDSKDRSISKTWGRVRKVVGLVDADKAIAETYVRKGWKGWEEGDAEARASSSAGRSGASECFSSEPEHAKRASRDRNGSVSSLFPRNSSKKNGRSANPPLEPLHVPADREERLAMGPTLSHTPRDWKMNDGHITRMRATSPIADSLRNGAVNERTMRGETPLPKGGSVRRLVRRASGPLRRTLSKISLKSKKSTESLAGGEDFFLPTPHALRPARPDRHSCYHFCLSSLREDAHKFDECFCDCVGCRTQERQRPIVGRKKGEVSTDVVDSRHRALSGATAACG
ncbi:hypothetical protein CspeluHIS016_0211200 [Cutaneotrichosporon spelunceum]|uniref:Uncharacterized protein n=1 Tax=Cutaneotrichosporon spelunceum TaxID=1672016 RepID=A0AAD3YBR2_9TREE|nr:hypothetical protein CspeluHIS016_0211200 [Cutaneotrichosporon spelunceum]